MNVSEAVQQIEKLFPGAPPDILKSLPFLGCCSEHAEDFEWYREHEWKDLRNHIIESVGDHDNWLDPIQFGSLDPIAFHYFFPGVLTGIGDIVKNQQPSPDFFNDPGLSFCTDWFMGASPPGKDGRERFRSENLPLFTKEERLAVKSSLEAFVAFLEASWQETKEVKKLIQEVWN
jgi:hypothetical protein